MKRALLLLALSSATLVEYDQELVEFICRFYLDSPPFSIAHDDKSSAWTRLVLTLPTVYTSHVCLGATRDFTVCRGLRDVFLFTPAAREADVPCAAVDDRADGRANRAKLAERVQATGRFGQWADLHLAETYPLRIPPPLHDWWAARPPPPLGRADARWVVFSWRASDSRLAPDEMARVARRLRAAFASENLLLMPASPRLGATASAPPFHAPDGAIVLTPELAAAHNRSANALLLACLARAAFVVTEAAGANLLAHYFAAPHVTLASPPAYVGAAALRNLGGRARLTASPAELLAALEEMTAAAAAAPPAAAISSPAGRDLATLRGRAIAARSPFAPRSDVPAVVCDALTPWAQKAPFNGEFGPELVTALPHAYFLHACGKLRATSSCGDLSDFYWFSPRHVAKACVRRASLWSYEGILGSYAGANAVTWLPPPLRARVRETRADVFAGRFGAATPRITIFNRIDCPADYRPRPGVTEPHHVCKPYLGTYDLDQILAKIYTYAPRASVAYHRSDAALAMKGFSPERWNVMADGGGGGAASNGTAAARALACPRTKKFGCVSSEAIEDWAFLRAHHPAVVKTRDLYAGEHRAETWNGFQNAVLAWSDCFISLQGGASYIAAFFGGHALVADFFGRSYAEENGAAPPAPPSRRRLYENAATYNIVLRRLSNQTLRPFPTLSHLLAGIDDWHAQGLCGLG